MRPGQGRAWAAARGACAGCSALSCGRSRSTTSGAPQTGGRGGRTGAAAPAAARNGAVLPHRLDAPSAGVGDAGDPVVDEPPVMGELDDIAGIEREPRGRRAKAAVSRPTQASASARRARRAASSGGAASGKDSAVTRAEPGVTRAASTTATSYSSSARATVHFQDLRQLGLLRRGSARGPRPRRPGRSPRPCRPARRPRPARAPHDEPDRALALHRVEAEVPGQRGDRGARALERGDEVALDRAPEAGDVDAVLGQAGAAAEVAHQRCERHRPEPTGQPVPEPPVRSVGPDARRARGRTDRAARPRSRRRSPRPGPCGRRRRRTGLLAPLPHQPQVASM